MRLVINARFLDLDDPALNEDCEECNGTGMTLWGCWECEGTGFEGDAKDNDECPVCEGSGWIADPCFDCDGKGTWEGVLHVKARMHEANLLRARYGTDAVKDIQDYWVGSKKSS